MPLALSYPLQESFRLLLVRINTDAVRTSLHLRCQDCGDAHLAALKSLESLVSMLTKILLANELALAVVLDVNPTTLSDPHHSVRTATTYTHTPSKEKRWRKQKSAGHGASNVLDQHGKDR